MRFIIQISTLEDAGEGAHGAAIRCLSSIRRMLKSGSREAEQQYCDSAIRLTVTDDEDDPLEPYCDVCGNHGDALRTPVEVCRDCYDIAKYGQEMLAAYGLDRRPRESHHKADIVQSEPRCEYRHNSANGPQCCRPAGHDGMHQGLVEDVLRWATT